MKKFIQILMILNIVLLNLIFNSCSKVFEPKDYYQETETIIKERNPKLPRYVRNKDISKLLTTRSSDNNKIVNSDKMLGYSYKVIDPILGVYSNVKFKVIDIDKVTKIDKDYITTKNLNYNTSSYYYFNQNDDFVKKSNFGEKYNGELSLKVATIIDITAKGGYQKNFNTQVENNNIQCFAQSDMKIIHNAFLLQNSQGALRKFARSCLSESFISDIYSSTIYNLYNSYGYFLLMGYHTGGKATVLYSSTQNSSESKEKNTKFWDLAISASVSWGTGNIKIGYNQAIGDSIEIKTRDEIKRLRIKVQTFGGELTQNPISTTQEIRKMDLSLSNWLQSLKHRTSTMIDISDNGLISLSKVIPEKNFKQRFEDTVNEVLPLRNNLIMPYIEIARVFIRTDSSNKPLYDILPILNTRQGDKIILKNKDYKTITNQELAKNSDEKIFNRTSIN